MPLVRRCLFSIDVPQVVIMDRAVLDARDFSALPVRDKAMVLRMVATADYGNWDNDENYSRVVQEAIRYRRIRGWYVFSITTPDSSVRKVRRRGVFADAVAEAPAPQVLNFE